MELFLYTALFAPLAGSLFAALFGASKKTKIAGIVPSALLGVSLVSSFVLLLLVFMTGRTIHVEMMTWMAAGDL
jgi:NADH-quinone oxidoreductase subunit L